MSTESSIKPTSAPAVLSAAEFRYRLSALVNQNRNHEEAGFAVAIVEFERLRLVSSCLSHPVADRLTDSVIQRLIRLLGGRARASSVWLMGHEGPFAILLEGVTSRQQAEAELRDLLASLVEPIDVPWGDSEFALDTLDPQANVSRRIGLNPFAGLACSINQSWSATEFVRNAEMALCAAAAGGAAHFVTFDPAMRLQTRSKLDTEASLRLAVTRGELVLHYQPIIDLSEGVVAGFEALIRWNHPSRGVVPPGDFIPIAEETGLIEPIGQWVLHQACLQLARWRAANPPGMRVPWISVNVSRRQLGQPDLLECVRRTLKETQADPALVHVEITESVIMEAEDAPVTLQKLRDLGIRLSMDDFGTGYSSLACLHQLPLDTIKIDRSFVSRIGHSRDFAAAVHAIVSLARNLDMDVIAEGVEKSEQVIALQALDCRYAQGYFFGRPVPALEAGKFIGQRSAVRQDEVFGASRQCAG